MQHIEELNELDMELYDYARDLFQQRYQYTRQQERRLQRLRTHNQNHNGQGLGVEGQGLGVGLWPSRSKLTPGPGEGEVEDPEDGGRTEEVGRRLPTEDYINQIINRW